MIKTITASLLAFAIAGAALAQTAVKMPTASELEQERIRIEAERKKVFESNVVDRQMQKIERERKELFDPENPATKNAPNNFPNIATPERSNVDLEALAKRYEQKAEARKVEGLMTFASFTMPKESLKRLIADTNRVGGVVVMRGFKDGSIKSTALAINELGEAGGNVQINPNAFTKYKIKAVPAIVLLKPNGSELVDNEGCALPDKYIMVAGDVGLSYAFEEIERRSPQFREMAIRYGRQLKGGVQ